MRLRELANEMKEEPEGGKGQKDRHLRFISNLYTNLLSCFVLHGHKGTTHNLLSSVGWKLRETRYASTQKRTRGNFDINYAEKDGKSFNQ